MGGGAGLDQQEAAVGFEMNVFDPWTLCSSRAGGLRRRLVHSWPDVSLGRSFQCGIFCLVGFCAPVLFTTPPPIPTAIPFLPYAIR